MHKAGSGSRKWRERIAESRIYTGFMRFHKGAGGDSTEPADNRPARHFWNIVPQTIQGMILFSFTIVSVLLTLFLGFMLYTIFARQMKSASLDSTRQILQQSVVNLEDYLVSMRRISDAMYYDVIKGKDIGTETVDKEMNLIYEAHKDNLVSFALFRDDGRLISAAPIATLKDGLDVRKQEWYTSAEHELENLQFSTPHVQNLFVDPTFRHYWVISLSRAVDLTDMGAPRQGILLVDMNYSTIDQMLTRLNTDSSGQYIYLCSSDGELIYHPKQKQINYGIFSENSIAAAHYTDGIHTEKFNGMNRTVIVSTVSYTGWKLVSVIPESTYSFGLGRLRYLVVMVVAITMLIIMIMNRLISGRISKPLNQLNDSIRDIRNGNFNPDVIYVGGTKEVQELGLTMKKTVSQIDQLMKDIVIEQEEKQKSEMDALQSQINPHFLYNTLDSIVWMIEGERSKEAVFMVTQLASLFRISLSRGKNIISIEQELKHSENYMNIQKIRYKNAFQVKYEIDPEIIRYCTVKLVLQPLLENAIYYGVQGMDGDGEITVLGEKKGNDIYITIRDNGFGMPANAVENLLRDTEDAEKRVPKHGSGVGLLNVHKRIRLRFGEEYGLKIRSELDEGTEITVHIPAVLFTEENQKLLESGKKPFPAKEDSGQQNSRTAGQEAAGHE